MKHFQYFKTVISGIKLPEKFTFPFYYEPHKLSKIAVVELQEYLENQTDFTHNFGINKDQKETAVGKMFGVLVVENQKKEIGYLAAFSGKLNDKSSPNKFVPAIFNTHAKDSFYKIEEEKLNVISKQISALEENRTFLEVQKTLKNKTTFVEKDLQQQRNKMKLAKKDRKIRRTKAKATLNSKEFLNFNKKLEQESFNDQFLYKELLEYRESQLVKEQKEVAFFNDKILALKLKRKKKSAELQEELFNKYQFLNQQKTTKGITEIFPNYAIQKPPAGTGDCSAPKLLQFAFQNNLKPIALAEFWWGISPNTEIRKHKNFYPACQGRCKPVLTHMLEGIEMDENPFLKNVSENKELEIIFEDDALLVVNKPAEFLSVPGKEISDSVYTRIKEKYPKATGPLIVHRLDMSTSGILLLTKTKEANKVLQSQFITRTVKKRYIALLEGIITENEGEINLPLRVDLDDRPRQLVCYEHGKNAKTKWKVIEKIDGKTRIHLYPITGRTHQLRVHVSHPLGLNTPIIGDDLYGKKANRLHLHAEFIEFLHPTTNKKMSFTVKADF